jgi:single-stranded DNA-binding protein
MLAPSSRFVARSAFSARTFSSSPVARLARINIIGRLAADPELVTTSSGQEIVRYAVGTNTGSGDSQKTSWWKVASFQEGGSKDYLLGLGKGSLVYVEGNAQMGSYSAEDGKTHQSLSIVQRKFPSL